MPYQVPNDSIVQAILRGRQANQECMNVLHYRPADPPAGDIADGLGNLEEIRAILDINPGGWSDLLSQCCQEDFTIDYVQLQYIWPTRMSYYRVAAEVLAGIRVGPPAPPNVQASVTFQGDAVGRHNRGAMRIPGLLAEDVTEGRISASLAADLNTLGDFLLTPFTPPTSALEYELVIFQRLAPGASLPVTHKTVQTTSRVERRRTVGLGT